MGAGCERDPVELDARCHGASVLRPSRWSSGPLVTVAGGYRPGMRPSIALLLAFALVAILGASIVQFLVLAR